VSTRNTSARQREAARKAEEQARARRQGQIRLVAIGSVLLVAGAVLALSLAGGSDEPSEGTSTASGAARTTAPPWPPQPVGLAERLAPFNFPPVGDESYHAHTLLSVFRNGEQVEVPANIGFEISGAHSSLHTHTPDGVIHMEADDPYPYELDQVFAAWGVAFDENRLGGDVADGENQVFIYVNGKQVDDPSVVLKEGDNVVVAYGEAGSFPTAPPTDALENA
jgi:hypothetical protein